MLQCQAVELELPPESWGDRFHRAYRLARHREGAGFTYREVARRVSLVMATNDVAIIRLEQLSTLPQSQRARQLAVLCLAVYGYDAKPFGLDMINTEPQAFDRMDQLLAALSQ